MATGKRKRYDGVETYLDIDLPSGATTVQFKDILKGDGGVAINTLNAGEYLSLSILDTNYVLYEIVHLVAYTSGAYTGTIERGQEGTTARDHFKGQKVVHAPTADDFFDVQDHLSDPNAHQQFIGTTVNAAVDAKMNDHLAATDPHPQYMRDDVTGQPLPPGTTITSGNTLVVNSGGKIQINQGGQLVVEGDLYIQNGGRIFINGKQLYISNTEPANPTANMIWLQTFGP